MRIRKMRATMSRATASARRRHLRKKATSRSMRSTVIERRLQRSRAKARARGKAIRASAGDSEVRAVRRVVASEARVARHAVDSAAKAAPVRAGLEGRAGPIEGEDRAATVDTISAAASGRAEDNKGAGLVVKAARVSFRVGVDATAAVVEIEAGVAGVATA